MIEPNKSYRLYGKMGKMRNMKPVSKDRFVTNLIYADIYTPKTSEECAAMEKELSFLQAQGTFEYRSI